jgi:hypothetical protein
VRSIAHQVAVSAVLAAEVTSQTIVGVLVEVATTLTGAASRAVAKTIDVSATLAAAVTRIIPQTVEATMTLGVASARSTQKVLETTSAFLVEAVGGFLTTKLVEVTATFAASVVSKVRTMWPASSGDIWTGSAGGEWPASDDGEWPEF